MAGSKQFTGQITVASRIIDSLSSGLYASPGACLKELVNNAYDADATRVEVLVKPDADRIIVADDGHGMDRAEFERHFQRISESYKRETSDTTAGGRPKIGKIGIGFIAANELCHEMEIHSTKAGSTELLRVTIDFEVMKRDPAERRREGDDLAKADYRGEVSHADREEHYTHLFLNGVRGEARAILAGAEAAAGSRAVNSLYGKSPSSVAKVLRTLTSWDQLDAYSTTMLEVALNVPVPYVDDWVPPEAVKAAHRFDRAAAALAFAVYYDGTELRKPTVFAPPSRWFFEPFTLKGEHVSAVGYFYAQHRSITPRQLQGVLIRIRQSAVGGYRSDWLGFPKTVGPLFQDWMSCELWADDRLEDAMNIDRQTLRDSHPAYVELQKLFHDQLRKSLTRTRKELYGAGSTQRRTQRAHEERAAIESVVARHSSVLGRAEAETLTASWGHSENDDADEKRLLRTYSVAELYELVLSVATEVLSPADARRFVESLTDKMRNRKP